MKHFTLKEINIARCMALLIRCVICLTTGPLSLPKRAVHTVWTSAGCFNSQYSLVPWKFKLESVSIWIISLNKQRYVGLKAKKNYICYWHHRTKFHHKESRRLPPVSEPVAIWTRALLILTLKVQYCKFLATEVTQVLKQAREEPHFHYTQLPLGL